MSIPIRCVCGHDQDWTDPGTPGVYLGTCPGCGHPVFSPFAAVERKKLDLLPPMPAESRASSDPVLHLDARHSPRERLYLALGLALIPLVFLSFSDRQPPIEDRIVRAIDDADEITATAVAAVAGGDDATLDQVLDVLPGNKLDASAWLPRQTALHWAIALAAAVVFLTALALAFPAEPGRWWALPAAALFTGTLGILLLLAVQWAALHSGGIRAHGRAALVALVLWLIGMSYVASHDPTMPWWASFLGYTFGVGLCEEICKLLPVAILLGHRAPGWRGAVRVGLASGVGFGVSEGVHYAMTQYNGIAPASIYFVRFASCVALHAAWAGASALMLWRQSRLREPQTATQWIEQALRSIAVPMLLHGAYNTCLKSGQQPAACGLALVSLAWLGWQVESVRAAEEQVGVTAEPA